MDGSATHDDDATLALEPPPAGARDRPELPATIGRFVVDGHIGLGGMGHVLSAHDPQLDRTVAIKLHRYRGRNGDVTAGRVRMLHEARAMAQLQHPNVVTVFDVGEHEGDVFIAMEVVDGVDLCAWLAARPRSAREIVDVFVAAARGLAAAHDAGLVHRDFKPSNLMIDATGTAKVLDFGLAVETEERRRTRQPWSSSGSLDGEDDSATGANGARLVYGTPKYMAPEQYFGAQLTAATDQYALCLALFEALAGEMPFVGEDFATLRDAKLQQRPRRSPRWLALPRRLRLVVERGLDPEGSRRWPSMQVFIDALERARGRPRWVAGGALGLVAAAAAVGVTVWPASEVDRCEVLQTAFAQRLDEARRAELAAHATGLGEVFARGWARVEPRVDAFARQWRDVHREVCVAQAPPSASRLDCLHAQTTSLDAALSVLAEGDVAVWQGADAIVDQLPRPSACRTAQSDLELRPGDAALAERVDRVRARLDRARSRHSAGEWKAALAEVEGLVSEADALGFAPLRAEVLVEVGQLRHQVKDDDEAIANLETAYFLAHDLRYRAVELRAANLLAQVVAKVRGDFEAADNWLHQAEAALVQLGNDPYDQVALWVAEATVLSHRNDHAASVDVLERALALCDEAGIDDVRLRTMLMNNIGHDWFRLGRYNEALALHRETLEIRKRELPGHPYVISSLNSVGNALAGMGDRKGSLDYHLEALALAKSTFGDDHPKVADTLNSIALGKHAAGDLEGAIETMEASLRVAMASDDEGSTLVGQALGNLGMLYRQAGDDVAALSAYRRAREALERAKGPNAPEVASVLHNEGRLLADRGDLEEAIARWERAIEIREATNGPMDTKLAFPLSELGQVRLQRGDAKGALVLLRRALELRERAGVAGGDTERTRFLVAKAIVADGGDRAVAGRMAADARKVFEATGQDEDAAEIDAWASEASIDLTAG